MPEQGDRLVGLNRIDVRQRFLAARQRTRAMFDMLDEAVYYERPIALRNPVVFYEGHIPAFAVNTLVKKALGKPGMDERLEIIFARGIDPESETAAVARGNPAWPSRDAVREYADAADQLVLEAIDTADLDRAGHPLLNRAQALWTILEHEEMHQETLAYIWHQLPHDRKRSPAGYSAVDSRSVRADLSRRVHIPTGLATLGTNLHLEPFAWDNEQNEHPASGRAYQRGRPRTDLRPGRLDLDREFLQVGCGRDHCRRSGRRIPRVRPMG